jgi:CMP-N,N'-diacetyllegionaminic acid synthase
LILGVIPARGGSKGIPGKNVMPVADCPLIAWTIDAAAQSQLLDRFVVSTEDEEIGRVAQSWGAEVLPRPRDLADDDTPTISVLQYVLQEIRADVLVLLQPTSPVRGPGLIDRCIQQFTEAGADSLATGFICKYAEYGKRKNLPRQKLPGFFYDDGNVYVFRSELIKGGDLSGEKIERVFLDKEESVDIDEPFDMWLAEQVLLKRIREGDIRKPDLNGD